MSALMSPSTPMAVKGALTGLGAALDREMRRRRELEAALAIWYPGAKHQHGMACFCPQCEATRAVLTGGETP